MGFGGMYPGEMHKALWQMEREGLLLCDRSGGGFRVPARWYEITEAGEAYLDFWADALARYREEIDLFFLIYEGTHRATEVLRAAHG